MEMEGMWLGENERSYFKFEDLEPNRKLSLPIYPKPMYDLIKDKNFKYTEKKQDEVRIISSDIAVMIGNSNNDASIYTVISLIPSSDKRRYIKRVVYMESMKEGHSTLQATRIRQLYEQFECDYIVLDVAGVGNGIYDNLCQPLYDKEMQKEYEAFASMNDEEMAKKCLVSNAPRKIYTIKANMTFNSDCAIAFRNDLRNKRIQLLIDENQGREIILGMKGYAKLPPEIQVKLLSPYAQTTALVNEMVNLEADINTDTRIVKLKEPRMGRKDRWSSVSYGNYFANVLEKDLQREEDQSLSSYFIF